MAHNVNHYYRPPKQIQYLDKSLKDEEMRQNTKVIVYLPIKADLLCLQKSAMNFGFR